MFALMLVGLTHSALQTTQIPKVYEQMSLAHSRNARSMWIVNVSASYALSTYRTSNT